MLAQLVLAFAAAQPVTVPPHPLLKQAIVARDAAFFELFFQGCDPGKLRTMITDDVEMYHDKGGFVFRGAEAMVAEYSKSCEARRKPNAWRSRRELVADSLVVDPVPGHGAMQFGEHLFYERKGDGPEKLVGRARFAQVWVLDEGNWKLSRILSYAHARAGQ